MDEDTDLISRLNAYLEANPTVDVTLSSSDELFAREIPALLGWDPVSIRRDNSCGYYGSINESERVDRPNLIQGRENVDRQVPAGWCLDEMLWRSRGPEYYFDAMLDFKTSERSTSHLIMSFIVCAEIDIARFVATMLACQWDAKARDYLDRWTFVPDTGEGALT